MLFLEPICHYTAGQCEDNHGYGVSQRQHAEDSAGGIDAVDQQVARQHLHVHGGPVAHHGKIVQTVDGIFKGNEGLGKAKRDYTAALPGAAFAVIVASEWVQFIVHVVFQIKRGAGKRGTISILHETRDAVTWEGYKGTNRQAVIDKYIMTT